MLQLKELGLEPALMERILSILKCFRPSRVWYMDLDPYIGNLGFGDARTTDVRCDECGAIFTDDEIGHAALFSHCCQ